MGWRLLTEAKMPILRVLVVEDNREAAERLATILRGWGYHVRMVLDAPSALADVETFLPDVVLSDLSMPGMSGFALAEKLTLKDVLLVATTAHGDDAARARSKAAGFHEHFVKPLDLPVLHRLLEERRQTLGLPGAAKASTPARG
jgi:CheY-like chemotaxis protein